MTDELLCYLTKRKISFLEKTLTLGTFPIIFPQLSSLSFIYCNNKNQCNQHWIIIIRHSCSNAGKIRVGMHGVLKVFSILPRFQPPEGGVWLSPRRAHKPGRQLPWQGLGLRFNDEHCQVTKLWNCEVRSGEFKSHSLPYFGWFWLVPSKAHLPYLRNWTESGIVCKRLTELSSINISSGHLSPKVIINIQLTVIY